MIKDLKKLFNSDVRVVITEGDYVNPTVIFKGSIYEVPSTLEQRTIDFNGVKVCNNALLIHLISIKNTNMTVEKFMSVVTFLLVKRMLIKLTPFPSKHIIASKDIPAEVISMITEYVDVIKPGFLANANKSIIATLKALDVRVFNNRVDSIFFICEQSITYSNGVKKVINTFAIPLTRG
jgi:hypothetical protein